jgi:hypothetical protein
LSGVSNHPKVAMTEEFKNWDSADYLLTDEDFEAYLEVCLEEAGGDAAIIVKAYETIERARRRLQPLSVPFGACETLRSSGQPAISEPDRESTCL